MRLCTHPEHAQYGLGHLPGLPRSDAEQATVLESLPSAYIAPGYHDGIMPSTFGTSLTPQQLADLVAFLNQSK